MGLASYGQQFSGPCIVLFFGFPFLFACLGETSIQLGL